MKHICNAAKEGRCKAEVGKCNHRRPHGVLPLSSLDETVEFCTEERFCVAQDLVVRCVEVELFPGMKNCVTVSDELAREFVDWERVFICNRADSHICGRLAVCFKEQLK